MGAGQEPWERGQSGREDSIVSPKKVVDYKNRPRCTIMTLSLAFEHGRTIFLERCGPMLFSLPGSSISRATFATAACFSAGGCLPASPNPSTYLATPLSSIELQPERVQFGELSPGCGSEATFKVRNRGTAIVEVARFETSCPCIRVSPRSISLRPRESAEIKVTFDPSKEPEFQGSLEVVVEGRSDMNQPLLRATVEVSVRGTDAEKEAVP